MDTQLKSVRNLTLKILALNLVLMLYPQIALAQTTMHCDAESAVFWDYKDVDERRNQNDTIEVGSDYILHSYVSPSNGMEWSVNYTILHRTNTYIIASKFFEQGDTMVMHFDIENKNFTVNSSNDYGYTLTYGSCD